MWTNVGTRDCLARQAELSAVSPGNSLHTSYESSLQGCTARSFPPIHKRHHNNKSQFLIFQETAPIKTVVVVKKTALEQRNQALPNILKSRHFHSVERACGLYTLLKNEYSTLAVQMHGGKPCPQQEPYARKAKQWNSA
jgi:hypothetical protein